MYPIYVLIALLPPVAMLIVGIWWKVSPPKMEGKGLAYRTQLSTKSPDAWAFAHKHCARLWVRMGVILTAVAGIAMYLLQGPGLPDLPDLDPGGRDGFVLRLRLPGGRPAESKF